MRVELWAQRFAGWNPLLRYARGAYQRLRGDYAAALVELQQSVGSEEHQLWAHAAGAQMMTLCGQRAFEWAIAVGHEHLVMARRRARLEPARGRGVARLGRARMQ